MISRRAMPCLPAAIALAGLAACGGGMDMEDAMPAKTENISIDRGKAEMVKAVIRMGAGEMELSAGATGKLMDGEFRSVKKPEVRYDGQGARGLLEIRSDRKKLRWGSNQGDDWKIRLDKSTPVDLELHLGAGESNLDLSGLALRSVEVHMGVGELKLNLDGNYGRDVEVDVHGGVGRAEIRLPRKMGAQVDAKAGIGSVDVRGLKKDSSGRYVNAAYESSSHQVRCRVRGGVGEIELIGDSESK